MFVRRRAGPRTDRRVSPRWSRAVPPPAAAPRGRRRAVPPASVPRRARPGPRVGRRVHDVAGREAVELQLRVGPRSRPRGGGQQLADRLEQALPVRPPVRPQVHADMAADGREAGVRDEVEGRVVPAAGAGEFLGLGAVGGDLRVDALGSRGENGAPGQVPVAGRVREGGELHVVERAVVVGGGALLGAEGAVQQPVAEVRVPGAHGGAVGPRPAGRAGVEDRDGIQDAGVGLREVDDADGPAVVPAGDELPVVQVRVHPGGRGEEPGAQDVGGLLGVLLPAGVVPGEREVVRGVEDLLDVLAVGAGVDLGVALPVALDVRAAPRVVGGRGLRGPPVRGLAEVVVDVAAGGGLRLVDDRPGALVQPAVGPRREAGDRVPQSGVAVVQADLRPLQPGAVEDRGGRGLRCRAAFVGRGGRDDGGREGDHGRQDHARTGSSTHRALRSDM